MDEVRGRRETRVFRLALAASLFLHLSAITIFRVVVYFPRNPVFYVGLRVVPDDRPEREPRPPSAPEIPAVAESGALRLGNLLASEEDAPDVELPTLEFAELDRWRLSRNLELGAGAAAAMPADTPPRDSLQLFGAGVEMVRSSLKRLAIGEQAPEPVAEPPEAPVIKINSPVEGLRVELEWDTPPRDRQAMITPPMEALWRLDPVALDKPISFVLQVDPTGRVTSVWSPVVDETGLLDSIQVALLKFRFMPVQDAGPQHMGTIRISRADEP